MAKTKNKQPANVMTLRLDPELEGELEAAQETTKLSKSDLARLSIERGLKIVLRQLTMTPESMEVAA